MKRIRFVADAIAVTEDGPRTLFSEGDIQDLNPASADRWLRRGVAVPDPDGKVGRAPKKKTGAATDKKDGSSDGGKKE